jgi:hypothetical protein
MRSTICQSRWPCHSHRLLNVRCSGRKELAGEVHARAPEQAFRLKMQSLEVLDNGSAPLPTSTADQLQTDNPTAPQLDARQSLGDVIASDELKLTPPDVGHRAVPIPKAVRNAIKLIAISCVHNRAAADVLLTPTTSGSGSRAPLAALCRFAGSTTATCIALAMKRDGGRPPR